ncbi:MAG: hypothetical protein AB9879_09785 [Methanothrix sp.]
MALDKNFWQELLRISDSFNPDLARVLPAAVDEAVKGVTPRALAEPLSLGDIVATENLIDWSEYDQHLEAYKPLLTKVLQNSGEASATWLSDGLKLKIRFDLVDPHAVAWINQHSAELVRYVGQSSKTAIREIIQDGFVNGVTPQQMALRIEQHIGLDPARSRSLAKYRAALLEGGVPQGEVDKLTDQFSDRLLKARGLAIAVNESLEAMGQGAYENTRQAVFRGVLDPAVWEGYRIITPDDRLCDRCRIYAKETRILPDGVYASTGRTTAKIHVSCRCCEGLRKRASKYFLVAGFYGR